jgi:hypothetical protein
VQVFVLMFGTFRNEISGFACTLLPLHCCCGTGCPTLSSSLSHDGATRSPLQVQPPEGEPQQQHPPSRPEDAGKPPPTAEPIDGGPAFIDDALFARVTFSNGVAKREVDTIRKAYRPELLLETGLKFEGGETERRGRTSSLCVGSNSDCNTSTARSR